MAAPARPGKHVVTVQRRIGASPSAVFDLLATPAEHGRIDGSGTVRAPATGPARLSQGAEFAMNMKHGMPYRSTNRVVHFEPDRAIAWETVGEFRGRRVVGGQVWAYEIAPDPLAPADPNRCLVIHTYDTSQERGASLMNTLGFERRARVDMARTLDRLADAVSSTA